MLNAIARRAQAEAKLDQIKALDQQFRDANPDILPKESAVTRKINPSVDGLSANGWKRDRELAKNSAEFAALIDKTDKTPDDEARLVKLRDALIKTNPKAQRLQAHADKFRRRMATREEQLQKFKELNLSLNQP